MSIKIFVAFLVSDKGSELKEVCAATESEAMNKIYMTASESTIIKSIYVKH